MNPYNNDNNSPPAYTAAGNPLDTPPAESRNQSRDEGISYGQLPPPPQGAGTGWPAQTYAPPTYRPPYHTYPAQPYYGAPMYTLPLESPEEKERKGLKKVSLATSLCLLAFVAVSVAASIVLLFAGLNLEKDNYLIFTYAFSIFISFLAIAVPFWVMKSVTRKKEGNLLPLKRIKPSFLIPAIFIGFAACMLANYAANLFNNLFNSVGIHLTQNPDLIEGPKGTPQQILYVISLAFAPAFFEEFAFRGILLQSLRRYGDGFAILISSLMFGALHSNFVQAPFAFCIGLIMAYLVVKTGSLWIGIIIHLLNNLFGAVFTILQDILDSYTYNLAFGISILVILLLGVISLIHLCRKDSRLFSLAPYKGDLSIRNRMSVFMYTPFMVIALIVMGSMDIMSVIMYTFPQVFEQAAQRVFF